MELIAMPPILLSGACTAGLHRLHAQSLAD